jgi:hypothetical protein
MENHMNIVLVHPIHGAKVAINQQEMEMDVKNGWSEYNPDTPAEVAPKAEKLVRNKLSRKVTEQPIEQPNEVPSFLTSASDESEGS